MAGIFDDGIFDLGIFDEAASGTPGIFDNGIFDFGIFDEQDPGTSTRTGTLAATEGADSAAFTGSVLIQGTLAATEGADTAAFSGTSGAVVVVPVGTGGGGIVPLSRIRGRKYTPEENRRKRELERLEAAIIAAEGTAPQVDESAAVDARAYAAAFRQLEKLLADAKAAKFERDDEDDIEFLLLAG